MKNTEDMHRQPTQPLSVADIPLSDTASNAVGLDQDTVVTPAPLTATPEVARMEARPTGSSWALKVVVGLCLVMSLTSLALNAFLIYSLVDARQTAVEGLDAAISALNDFGGQGFHYDYHLEEMVPVSADIPMEQDIVFPFEGNLPINTTVEVPIDAGPLGTFVMEVPIDTSVYVNTEVPIRVEETFHVSTTFPVSMTIPIDVQPDDPEILRLLSQVREWLVRLRDSL